ncbi:GroES-like protein [Nemania serpens]|nr:GroES-like protein [Nemania serpens]
MATHLAAAFPAKGEPLTLQTRPAPKPGPGELLIQVKSVGLNPADVIMHDTGLLIPTYPAVTGFDVSGLVLAVGDDVPVGAADDEGPGLLFRPGVTRVAAYAAFFWRSCNPDYGAFQEQCLVPWQHAVPLPESISWSEAATLAVAVAVPLNAWDVMGIPRLGASSTSVPTASTVSGGTSEGTQQNKTEKKEALLVWGASSSVGTMGVQSARLLREDEGSIFAAVYATAGAANLKYVASLGADRVFDYKEPQVVDAIISAAREDGLAIRHCFLATGQLVSCQAVLGSFLGDGQGKEKQKAQIASAPPIPQDAEGVDGVETIFVQPSNDERERLAQFRYWMGTWLRENLIKGAIRPSPEPRVVGEGLGAINAGLDRIQKGVSCTKLVVEVAK